MSFAIYLPCTVGAILVSLRILAQIELWQRKEYRWDRLRSLLFSEENRVLFPSGLLVGMILLDIGWLASIMGQDAGANMLGWSSLFLFLGQDIVRIRARGLYRPEFTLRALLILGLAALLTLLYILTVFIPETQLALQWATLVVFMPVITASSVIGVNIPAKLRQRSIIARAASWRARLTKLTVLGITGSFGKTSTKYFLSQLFSNRYDVATTTDHRNSALAVAYDMLAQLTPKTKIYIAEMGAYRRGEIKELAELTRPKIGLITNIGNQHAALFGSSTQILRTKWELIETLPVGGTAVLNANDERQVEQAKGISQKIIWFSTRPERKANLSQPVTVFVDQVKIAPRSLACILHLHKIKKPITVNLLSDAMLTSLVAAAAGALALGLPPKEIFARIPTLHSYARTMELRNNRFGATIIDDSYSANEPGAQNAIEHLARFAENKKIIILAPLIELGPEAAAVHHRLGAILAASRAQVYITAKTYLNSIIEGGRQVNKDFKPHVYSQPRLLAQVLRQRVTADSVVLIEGRVPEIVRMSVLNP
ncbi:MAG: Mur ligase family protein [Candidatus Andersenbacteria bacterium]